MASRTPWRTAGAPTRRTTARSTPDGVSPGPMSRVETPKPQVAALTSQVSEPFDQSDRPILSAMSASCVAASGTRSSASAIAISASPSLVDSPYSRRKSSSEPTPLDRARIPSMSLVAVRSARRCAVSSSLASSISRATTASSGSA